MSLMIQTRRRRARRLLAVAAVGCAALPTAPALAARDQLSLIEDEKLMLESGPAIQAHARERDLGSIRAQAEGQEAAQEPDGVFRRRARDARLVRGRRPGARDAGAA